jgi:hypothetical protein
MLVADGSTQISLSPQETRWLGNQLLKAAAHERDRDGGRARRHEPGAVDFVEGS